MKYIKKISWMVLFVSLSLTGYAKEVESTDPDKTIKEEQEIARNMMKLVLLKNVETLEGIQAAQDAYLNEHYKGYEFRGGHVYGMLHGMYIHGITVFNREEPAKTVFFDMTDIYKKLEQSSDEATRTKVRKLMRRHADLKK